MTRRIGPSIDPDALAFAYEYGVGIPCGASYISPTKTCREGSSGSSSSSSPKMSRSDLDEYWQDRAELSESRYNSKLEKATTTHTGERPPALVKKMEPYTKLSGDEKAAIQMYGAAGNREEVYGEMNMKLRTGQAPSPEKEKAVEFTTQHLESGLKKLPDTQGEFYRAMAGAGAQSLQGLKPGDTIQDRGFGSYSDKGGPNISPFIDSQATDNVVMVVQGKRFKNVSPVMPYQEGEHLALPGTRLRLVRVDEEGYYARKLNKNIPTYYFEEV